MGYIYNILFVCVFGGYVLCEKNQNHHSRFLAELNFVFGVMTATRIWDMVKKCLYTKVGRPSSLNRRHLNHFENHYKGS